MTKRDYFYGIFIPLILGAGANAATTYLPSGAAPSWGRIWAALAVQLLVNVGSIIAIGRWRDRNHAIEAPGEKEDGELVASRIEGFIARFVSETWAHEDRKMDVLGGMRLSARIARGEEQKGIESP